MVEQKHGVALRKTTNVLANIDLVNNREAAMLIFKDLFTSGKMNVKSPTDVMAMYIKSQELGIPFMTASDHMHMVNGKAGVDIHILRAKILMAGCISWTLEQDYTPLYEYKDNTGALVGTHYQDKELLEIYEVPKGTTPEELGADAKRIFAINKVPVFKSPSYVCYDNANEYRVLNRGTVIKFERDITFPNGDVKKVIEYGRFTTEDLITAGLHQKKDGSVIWDSPHIKYPQVMQEHRAWTFGGRKIGADIILGLYETKEVYDMNNIEYNTDDQGEVTVVESNSPQ